MGRKVERIKVRKGFHEYIDFEGSFESIREMLNSLEEKYPGWDLSIEREYSYSEYESDKWDLYGSRLENDEEYEARMEKNRNARKAAAEKRKLDKLKKEQEERELFEKLKDKYGEA